MKILERTKRKRKDANGYDEIESKFEIRWIGLNENAESRSIILLILRKEFRWDIRQNQNTLEIYCALEMTQNKYKIRLTK